MAFAVSGCGGTEVGDGRIELVYWRTLTGGAGAGQDAIVERFNASQKSVRVTAQFQGGYGDLATKLMTAAVAGRGPDITQLGTFEIRQFARSGVLVDLRPFLEGPEGIDTSDWPATMADAGRVDDGIYWLPFNVTVPILYYNPEAFREAGIVGPPETWDAFFEAARILTQRGEDGRVVRHGLALWNITWPLLSVIWSEGGELTTRDYGDITLDAPEVVAVMKEFQDLVREKAAVMPDAATGGHRGAFTSGRAAMILDSPAPLDEIRRGAVGFEPALALYPAGNAGRVYAPGGGGIAMMAHVPEGRREAAWQFMKFMLAPEQIAAYAKASGYVAFTDSAQALMDADDPNVALLRSALPYLRGDFSVNMSAAVRTAFDEAYQRIILKLEDVETALREADRKAEIGIREELK